MYTYIRALYLVSAIALSLPSPGRHHPAQDYQSRAPARDPVWRLGVQIAIPAFLCRTAYEPVGDLGVPYSRYLDTAREARATRHTGPGARPRDMKA